MILYAVSGIGARNANSGGNAIAMASSRAGLEIPADLAVGLLHVQGGLDRDDPTNQQYPRQVTG